MSNEQIFPTLTGNRADLASHVLDPHIVVGAPCCNVQLLLDRMELAESLPDQL